MTQLYVSDIDTKKLEYAAFDQNYIEDKLESYNIIFDHRKAVFIDTYPVFKLHTISSYSVADYHTHDKEKVRILVRGTGVYYFKVDKILIELHLVPGDCVTIPEGLEHKFISFGQTTILKSE
jgi:cupin superfamily acireductone dioxygenase involved in methionine salvage